MNRTIFHVDINSAFLSWEAAKRVAEGQEDLRLVPSAVGGDRNKRTGVILAKSIGCTMPILAKVLHLDPAIMAAPLITTVVDACSLVIYFKIACTLLGIL